MNKGTLIRTILVIATCFNTALLATDVAQFGNETVNLIYKILSVAANFVIVFCATWFNNDYSEEACIGTGITRQLKAENADDYVGDYFYNDEDEAHEDYINDEIDIDAINEAGDENE